MRIFKLIDYWIQVLLIGYALTGYLVTLNPFFLAGCYALIGIYQVVSMVIHAIFADSFYASINRGRYYRLLLILIPVAALCASGLPLFVWLLIAGITLAAILYPIACYQENTRLAHKRLIHLK